MMDPMQQTIEAAGLAAEAGPMIGAGAIALGFVVAVVFQRLGEWILIRRNEVVLRDLGWTEAGARHLPAMVGLQAAWLLACGWVALAPAVIVWELIGLYVLLQFARLWIILSLGPFWTLRVMSHAEAPLLRRGPYRHLRHPLYCVVLAEVAILPLAFGAWAVAAVFAALTAALLWHRVRVEEAAIAGRPEVR